MKTFQSGLGALLLLGAMVATAAAQEPAKEVLWTASLSGIGG